MNRSAASFEHDAELAASYIAARVRERSGSRFLQGARKPPLTGEPLPPALTLLATTRLREVPDPVARALVFWGLGERRVHLLTRVPRALEVLAWQAKGERCVSLLPAGVATAPHEDGLAFATHDLCHLEKLVDPEHHAGQVGFFRAVLRATEGPDWARFVSRFDDPFVADLEHVIADMNGSAVFLLAALKMKLKMAVRRRESGGAVVSGGLTAAELAAFAEELETLLALLALPGLVRDAARKVSTRRDDHDAASAALAYFEELGGGVARPLWRAVS